MPCQCHDHSTNCNPSNGVCQVKKTEVVDFAQSMREKIGCPFLVLKTISKQCFAMLMIGIALFTVSSYFIIVSSAAYFYDFFSLDVNGSVGEVLIELFESLQTCRPIK